MPWWGWVLVWLALFAAAAVLHGLLLLRLWRTGKGLLADLARAERVLSAVPAALDSLPHSLASGGRERRDDDAWDTGW